MVLLLIEMFGGSMLMAVLLLVAVYIFLRFTLKGRPDFNPEIEAEQLRAAELRERWLLWKEKYINPEGESGEASE
jgi:hypothetical protein